MKADLTGLVRECCVGKGPPGPGDVVGFPTTLSRAETAIQTKVPRTSTSSASIAWVSLNIQEVPMVVSMVLRHFDPVLIKCPLRRHKESILQKKKMLNLTFPKRPFLLPLFLQADLLLK